MFQIYELLLFYTKHVDHNVVTASLETLQQLLRAAPPPLLKVLTTRGAITATTIYEHDIVQEGRPRSASESQIQTPVNLSLDLGDEW